MHGSRGRGGGTGVRTPPPPLRFVRGGAFCGYLIGRRGGPEVVFIFFFFSLASTCYTWCKYLKNPNHFQVKKKRVSLSPVIHIISGFHESALSNPCLFCIKLHDFTQFYLRPKKKICVFTVRRPTLIFGLDPKLFYNTFSRKSFQCHIFAFQCSFWCLRHHYFDKNKLNVTPQV